MGTPARFAVAQRSTAECLGLFAAAQRLFERRGVDFDLVAFETAAERGVEGLIAGEWDFIEIGIIPLVRLRADGHDPAIVVGTTPMNTNFLMGRHDITRMTELAGGQIGCLSLAGQTAAVARAVLARSGVADAVELVPLGKYSKIFDAISAGDIHGAILAGDFRFLGEARHGMRIIADIGSEIRMPGTCVVTTRRAIAHKPELTKQIVGTYVDAVPIFKTHPDTAKAFLHNHLEFEEGVIEHIYEYYRSIFQTRPSLPHIQVAIDHIAKVRPDVSGMTPADLINMRFLDEIERSCTRTAQDHFGSLGDIAACPHHVRFTAERGRSAVRLRYPLSAIRGHRAGPCSVYGAIPMKVHGQCHCGAITYEAEVEVGTINVCHCLDCQTLTGSAFRTNIQAPAQGFHLLSGNPRRYTKTADSGAKRVHAFCEICGAPVYACDPKNPKTYSLRVGALNERALLGRPIRQIWTKRRLPWISNLEGVPEIDGQP